MAANAESADLRAVLGGAADFASGALNAARAEMKAPRR
jgi:hypothetical protein